MTSGGRPEVANTRGSGDQPARRGSSARRTQPRVLVLPETLSVQRLAELIDQNPIDVIKQLMRNGIMAAMNQMIDYQMATLVTTAFGIRTTMAEAEEETTDATKPAAVTEDPADLSPRPPVVTILGHVDHGKTALLDTIRKTQVAEREVGGITQHIGAYQAQFNDQDITFLDTPGHAAFTAIRARGARVTDIAVLVVAADDGMMPQTIEALNHAKAANVPIIVAINKMDLPGADPERVKRQLSEQDLLVEDWGGDVISSQVSAKTGEGIDELMENILLVAELAELQGNPNKSASGAVIEARLDRKRGPTATVLVQDGTLRVGDYVVGGSSWGRVKAINNYQGIAIKEATPGVPAEILGFGSTPQAGDLLSVVGNERSARALAEEQEKASNSQQNQVRALTLEEIVQHGPGTIKELNLVLKADVQGSVEAVRLALEQLVEEDIKVRVLHSGSGAVTESDVMLASASEAIVVRFTVGAEPSAERLAERLGVEIRNYNIIYQLIDDVALALHGMLEPVYTDVVFGQAEIREIFPSRRGVQIAGCRVTEGRISKAANVRVLRNGELIHETTIESIRHFRDEVTEMTAGSDCGVMLQGFNDFEQGDMLEAHRQERGRR
ncbi:MAG: translation initiation factor IF-2 [SAR202 cluster bacterium Io17-Chloro-G9]|nr:MAG: translation initiation factor IF-2 [SAR202 cluster bacterium Io17-Chloro-G9]